MIFRPCYRWALPFVALGQGLWRTRRAAGRVFRSRLDACRGRAWTRDTLGIDNDGKA